MSSSIVSPFPFFTDTTGAPLEGGYIFIGQSNLNPETAPVNVFWDAALTIPAAQPVRTVGGYPSRQGTPSRFYSATDTYSITVRNKNRVLVFSAFDQSDSPTSVFDISTQLITATASQTTFTLTTFTYLPGTDTLQVFRNGLRLNLGLDYLETNSSTVTLTAPAALGDQFLFQGGAVVTGNQVPGSQVSFLQAGTGAVTRNMQDKAREVISRADFTTEADYLSAASTISTGGFWMDQTPQPKHWRFADRVFIGAAASETNGNKVEGAPATGTFLTTQMDAFWMERGAGTLSVNGFGEFGGVFAARSSDKSKTSYFGDATIGVLGIATNDDTTVSSQLVWGGYFEANRDASADTSFGIEIAVKNKGNDVVNYPNLKFPAGSTIGIWLAGGGDASYYGAPANPSTCAVLIGKNSASWNKGIVFTSDGIAGTDGLTGSGTAIAMARGHVVGWYNNSNSQCATVLSTADDVTKRVGIQLLNDSMYFTKADALAFQLDFSAGKDNYVRVSSNVAGSPPVITSTGSDANVDLYISPKGSGVLRYGAFNGTSDSPISGYIQIKDNSGAIRKLAIIS
jgi:hypothetical protein